jgi:two-component system chemotaxis response regulator CheY
MADKILIVDDSVSMRQMTSIVLKGAGYTVDAAADGPEGLSKLDDDVRVVITDYNMPGMNGVEFVQRVRSGSVAAAVPIVMLTTESDQSKMQAGREAGATAWLVKPFDKEKLLKVIKRVTGSVSF